MAIITLNFQGSLNISAQKNDIIWLAPLTSGQSGSNHPNLSSPKKMTKLGVITNVNQLTGRIKYEEEVPMTDQEITDMLNDSNSYFFFAKDQVANTSGILGYYASVVCRNYTKKSAEIFAIGTNYAPSSK